MSQVLVENINGFDFIAYIPPVFKGLGRDPISRTARVAYAKMLDVLDAAQFYSEDSLNLQLSERGFEVQYADADLGFSFALVDEQLILRRTGSGLKRFEHWYRSVMPSVGSLVDAVLRELEKACDWPQVDVLRAQCRFKVIAYNFLPLGAPLGLEPTRNSQLLSRIISSAPNDVGSLVGPSDVMNALGRIDFKVSRWFTPLNGSPVREVYDVEAPGNRNYSSLWLTFSVVGETFEQNELARQRFEFDSFIANNCLDLYDELFVKKFVNGFLPDLFDGYEFLTTSSTLP